jgi:hypothetical protein
MAHIPCCPGGDDVSIVREFEAAFNRQDFERISHEGKGYRWQMAKVLRAGGSAALRVTSRVARPPLTE